jgi:hypothetical protein
MRVLSIVEFDKTLHRTEKSIAGKCDWAEVGTDHDAKWTVEASHERASDRTYAVCSRDGRNAHRQVAAHDPDIGRVRRTEWTCYAFPVSPLDTFIVQP